MTHVVVGRIGRPHGIRGDVTVEVRTDDPDARFAPGAVLHTEPAAAGPLTVARIGHSAQIMLLGFAGIDDRAAAESLRGTLLTVDAASLPATDDPDEFYDRDLIGLRARHVDGSALGTVTAILHAPASPVLTVTRPDGGQELVPFVAAIVPEVDVTGGTLVIDPPDGMFE